MLICMRTTLNLPDALASAAKERAHQQGRTLTSLIEQALMELLDRSADDSAVAPLPTWGKPGDIAFLVDIDDKDAVWSALDDAEQTSADR